MKKIFFSLFVLVSLASCSVCSVTSNYNYTTDSGEVCLKCTKISQTMQDAINKNKTIKVTKW